MCFPKKKLQISLKTHRLHVCHIETFILIIQKNHWWNFWTTLPATTFSSSSVFIRADEFMSINFNAQKKYSPTRYWLLWGLSINSRELKYSALCRSGFNATVGPGWVPHWSPRKPQFTQAVDHHSHGRIMKCHLPWEKLFMPKAGTEQRAENCRQAGFFFLGEKFQNHRIV